MRDKVIFEYLNIKISGVENTSGHLTGKIVVGHFSSFIMMIILTFLKYLARYTMRGTIRRTLLASSATSEPEKPEKQKRLLRLHQPGGPSCCWSFGDLVDDRVGDRVGGRGFGWVGYRVGYRGGSEPSTVRVAFSASAANRLDLADEDEAAIRSRDGHSEQTFDQAFRFALPLGNQVWSRQNQCIVVDLAS